MSQQTRSWRLRRFVIAAISTLSLAIPFIATSASPAQAAPVRGFEPGNIISDALFYDGNAMTAAEVQSFLNGKVSSCLIGKPPYMPGAKSPSGSGNIVASACLKDFKMSTTSRPADKYCGAYTGKANETAAQIIAKVGAACGISQKVLLVMLEKEQSLVTDDWPVTRMYNYAMGMNCPDSGPNNSANCNSDSAGFFLQVMLGARQLKVYKGNPDSFNYKPFQTNTIQWHPDRDRCGTSQVYIENWATAALYIYTPYRPNQAALDAGWGTGDSCSSYGNRNFYLFYTEWFGKANVVPDYPLPGTILRYWHRYHAEWLGQPISEAVWVDAHGGGYLQYFVGGFVYERKGGTAVGFTRNSPFIPAFGAAGGIEGDWGWPLSGAVNYGPGNNVVRFQGGAVVETAGVGVFLVPEDTRDYWESTGGFKGSLGYPTAEPREFNDGTSQVFDKADLYASASGIHVMPRGQIRDGYLSAGANEGSWGWPRGRQVCSSNGSMCSMDFDHGVATWTTTLGLQFTPLSAPPEASPVKPGSGESIAGGAA